ncbi:MAG: glycine zipper 2TM domain-containing protein [Verrucomicrobia bacterium]|nr:glycine zipper domain-containing protein [Kiritimatiellia bacterium]MCO6401274.1 glycine zipper 2TM domain-containing protein [Verrucomicrobiota bacterium]
MKRMIVLLSVVVVGAGAVGCASPQYQARRSEANSAIAGAVLGGALGGILGNNVGDGKNDVLGAAIGAASGAWVGQQYGQGQDSTRHRLESLEVANSSETVMINNSNGSYTPVMLTKVGYGQYRGPRGEIYPARPTEEQLKVAYGF